MSTQKPQKREEEKKLREIIDYLQKVAQDSLILAQNYHQEHKSFVAQS